MKKYRKRHSELVPTDREETPQCPKASEVYGLHDSPVYDQGDGSVRADASADTGIGWKDYITIYESELQIIAGLSALWGRYRIETGGELCGLWTHGGKPVILLVTGPGPKAIHESAYFEQDIEFFRRTNGIITKTCGLQCLGTDHGHHFLGIAGPSSGDVCQVQGITTRNNITRWCEIITTCEGEDEDSRSSADRRRDTLNAGDSLRITVNAYLYSAPQRGEKAKVPLRVLSGMSPFRLKVLADGTLDPADIGEYGSGFPMDRISYDFFDFQDTPFVEADELLRALEVQCQELPEEAQKGISFCIEDGSVAVTLPLPDESTADVCFSEKPPHLIRGVCIKNRAKTEEVDATGALPLDGRYIRLKKVYEILASGRHKMGVAVFPAQGVSPQ